MAAAHVLERCHDTREKGLFWSGGGVARGLRRSAAGDPGTAGGAIAFERWDGHGHLGNGFDRARAGRPAAFRRLGKRRASMARRRPTAGDHR